MSDELDRYREFLEKDDPLTIAILKGHLVLESLFDDILGGLTDRGDLLLNAANSFHRKRLIVQAHAGTRSTDDSWKLIQILNTLRNDIAHNLEPTKSENRLHELATTLKARDPKGFSLIPDPRDPVQLVSHAVSFLIGFLQGYRRDTAA